MSGGVFGRDAELRMIDAFIGGLAERPGALVVAGEAGAGKTTLLRSAVDGALARGLTVLQTAPARADLRLAFAGLADLLEPKLPAFIDSLPGPQARALRVALLLDEAPSRAPEPRTIAAGFRAALTELARPGPVLAVIDDVQWLDPASEAAIGYAIRRLEHEQVGLLCAQRTAQPGAGLPLELDRGRLHSDVLPLGGLSLGALHRMLHTRLGASFPHPVLRRIEAGSAGNPFIALEIGRAMLRRSAGAGTEAGLPVPATLSELVGERLGALPAEVLAALEVVAVMPHQAVEQYLASGVDSAALDAAVQASVLEHDAGRLAFSHPLLAAAVAADIPPARLRKLHATAAGVTSLPEERARHRALASAGPSAEVAAELAETAGLAAARGAPSAAAELFELAAGLTPAGNAALVGRRRLDSARQLAVAGDARAARALLQDLAASLPPGTDRSDALRQLGPLYEDSIGTAAELLTQALAEAGDDPVRTADIHMVLSDTALHSGDQALALAEAERALADAERAGDLALIASALAQAYCYAYIVGAEPDERRLKRALHLEQTVGRAPLRTQPSFVAGFCHMGQGRLAEAEAEFQRVLDFAIADGVEYSRADALYRLSLLAMRRGDARRAARLAAEGLDIAEQLDLPQLISAMLYAQGRAALQRGNTAVVREFAERGLDLARRAGDRPYVISFEALLGALDLALADYAAAATRYRPLVSQSREIGTRIFATQGIAADAIEALSAVGATEEAAALLADMAPLEQDFPAVAVAMTRCRGLLAVAHGDLETAKAELVAASRLAEQDEPQPIEQGRTLLMLGVVQRRQKQRAEARATLTEALTIFESVEAPLWAARATAEISRISGRSAGPADLTETERRVAELVAQGLSNREVAAELFVTVRAIESTLTKAYAKLGVRSRTELASRIWSG